MSLQTRLDAIERQQQEHSGGRSCPECGHYKGALINFRVVTDPAEQVRDEDQSCSTCGRERLKFTINLSGDSLSNEATNR